MLTHCCSSGVPVISFIFSFNVSRLSKPIVRPAHSAAVQVHRKAIARLKVVAGSSKFGSSLDIFV